MKKPDPKQGKLRLEDKRRRLAWVKVAAGTAVVLVSLVVIWYAARVPEMTIASLSIQGTTLADSQEIERMVREQLSGTYAFLIPRAYSLTFPKSDMLESLMRAFPEIASVSITRDGWQALSVHVNERTAAALWCGDNDAAAECFLMDETGFVFAPYSGNTLLIKFSGVIEGAPIGQTYASDFAEFKSYVEEISATAHRTPEAVSIDEHGDVRISFVQGGVLTFVKAADHLATLDNVASVFASRRLDTNERLEYADFRYGNKVYVKFIEE